MRRMENMLRLAKAYLEALRKINVIGVGALKGTYSAVDIARLMSRISGQGRAVTPL